MKKKLYIVIGLTAILISNCKKALDINTNPNAPQQTDASNLLAPMLANMDRGVWFDSRYIGQYVQQWGSPTADNLWDRQGYSPGTDTGGEMWRQHYYAIGSNVDLLLNDAIKTQKWDYAGVGTAIRAWSWQTSTDLYGEMILKQAWDPKRTVFDYDPQSEVYAEVVRLCNQAIEYLNRTDGTVSTANLAKGDYMYYGDRQKWLKFVYGILAVNASHLSNKANYDPQKVIDFVDKSFTTNADNATIQNNGTSSGDSNFWGTVRGNLNSFRQSEYMVKLLDGRIFTGAVNITLDPRLPNLLTPSTDGIYRGVVANAGDPNNGVVNTSIPYLWGTSSTTSLPVANFAAKYIFRDNSRGVIMTYAQLQFIKAEAQFKKGDIDGALVTYKNAIGASIDFVSNPPLGNAVVGAQNLISGPAKTAYLSGPCVKQTAATLQLSDILQQKFIALFGWGQLEAWSDMRRYSYDNTIFQGFVNPSSFFPDNGGKLVYRLRPRYNSEYVWNIEALKKIGATQADFHTTKPWFILP